MNLSDEATRIYALQLKVGELERKLNFVMQQLHDDARQVPSPY